MLAEALDVAHVCTLEAEDCLVVIADRHDVWIIVILASQIEQQSKLRQVCVLEFVDHDELELLLEVCAQFWVRFAGLNNG